MLELLRLKRMPSSRLTDYLRDIDVGILYLVYQIRSRYLCEKIIQRGLNSIS
jgi:hypothetical protein